MNENITTYNREHYLRYRHSILKKAKERYKKNSEKINKRRKYLRKKNAKLIKIKRHEYYKKNSEKIKKQRKCCYIKNFKKIALRNIKYVTERRKKDPIYYMLSLLRRRMVLAIKYQSTKKSTKTIDLLGASKEKVWNHLVSQFKKGMTIENHGRYGWHIDHIKPCSSFDLSDPEQQKACFHYTNLQPLWWWENLEKGNKIIN